MANPIANVGMDQELDGGDTGSLSGSLSLSPTSGVTITSYAWTAVTSGAPALSSYTTANPTFVAPSLATRTRYDYSLKVTDSNSASSTNVAVQTIYVLPTAGGTGGGGSSSGVAAHAPQHATNGSDSLSPYFVSYPSYTLSSNEFFLLAGSAQSTATTTQSREIAVPFFIPRQVSINQLVHEVTAAGGAGSVIRLGIRAFDVSNGLPVSDVPLLDAGTIDGTSATIQAITLSSAFVLTPGWYFYTVTVQGSATLPTQRVLSNGSILYPAPWRSTVNTIMNLTTYGYYQNGVTGALPSTWTNGGITGVAPRVAARVA